jgi:hypothetical protein
LAGKRKRNKSCENNSIGKLKFSRTRVGRAKLGRKKEYIWQSSNRNKECRAKFGRTRLGKIKRSRTRVGKIRLITTRVGNIEINNIPTVGKIKSEYAK